MARATVRSLVSVAKPFVKKRIQKNAAMAAEVLKCDPQHALKIVEESLYHFALNWLAQVAPDKVVRPGRERQVGFELLERNQKEGRGTLLLCMHMGLWEFTSRSFYNEEQTTAVIVAVQHNPLCDKIFNDLRTHNGFHRMIHNRLGVRHLLKYLKKGGSVGILADVDIGKTGICVPFCGKMASTPSWPAELAMRTDAKLLMCVNHVEDGVPITTLEDMPDPRDFVKREHGTWELSKAINDAMSEKVLQYPEQWFWMQRRWKTPIEKLKAPPQL
jgi:KDO2-lipid IV(A) lauroyltransferase